MEIDKVQSKGISLANTYNIAICSIVRDCNKNLVRNIPVIEKIRSYFKSSVVIIFENDSKDKTKQTLKKWSENSSNIYVECDNFKTKTIPDSTQNGVNKYFSNSRITKMANYRNQYLIKLEELNLDLDFVIVVDLDVSKIQAQGIFHSLGLVDQWDVISANGYSLSPKFKRRYHDTFALVELGNENIPQTEESIKKNAEKWDFSKNGQPLIPVYSAFGGLSIYRYDAIKNLRYRTIKNEDPIVEVHCEHFSFCYDIRKNGFNRIFINPELKLKYQSFDFKLIKKYILNKFKTYSD